MDIKNILSKTDHTLLAQDCTWEQIREICDDGITYGVASVCIPPYFVKKAKEYVGDRLKICTVIGFPLGYCTTPVKVSETIDAVIAGADEIDMVANICALKRGDTDEVLNDIKAVRAACRDKVLKVIIETCLLSDEQKITMCDIVDRAGADFIKTSTGFSKGGATFHDVEILATHCNAKVKAAGGISSLEDAQKMLDLGADRLGTSRLVKIVKSR